jgi:hypothetical protein
MSRKPGELTEKIKEAISNGCNTPTAIKEYLKKFGLTASNSIISLTRSGKAKKSKHICIPYTSFKEEKHLDSFYSYLSTLQDWVGNNSTFIELLKTHIEVLESMK